MVYNKYSTVIIFLFLLIPCATPLTFNFPNFPDTGNTNLSLEGSAFIDSKVLRFTKTNYSQNGTIGRATYTEPFLLCDNTTGDPADFSMSLSFVIDSRNGEGTHDEGIAFFLAPLGMPSLSNTSDGGRFGLPFNSTLSNEYPYVAVEFDTGDHSSSNGHVGIDINSIKSVATKPWNASMKDRSVTLNSAKVSYDSGTLIVAFTTYDDLKGTQVVSSLSYKVDMTKYLPDQVVAGFSASTGKSIDIISWKFLSSNWPVEYDMSLVVPPTPGLRAKVKPRRKKKTHLAVVIGSVVGGCMLVAVLGVGLFNSCKRKENRDSTQIGQTTIKGLRRFSYEEVALATRKFADGEKLGEDKDGVFYRGFRYDMNSYVTVKRISYSTRKNAYEKVLRKMSLLDHKNLMNLIGWCDERGELLLVFEFMPKGTLDSYLVKPENSLKWKVRYEIAQQVAEALDFLDEIYGGAGLHMNIRSSNIMLDSNFTAKLGNALLSESRNVDAYGAPDYEEAHGFGDVALEIARGQKSFEGNFGGHLCLVDWLWDLYTEGKIIEAADPKLLGEFDKEQMERLLVVGLWCACADSSRAPSPRHVIPVLNYHNPLPLLIRPLMLLTTGSSSERTTNESSDIYSYSTDSSSRWGPIDHLRISAKQRWRRLSIAVRFLGLIHSSPRQQIFSYITTFNYVAGGRCDNSDADGGEGRVEGMRRVAL